MSDSELAEARRALLALTIQQRTRALINHELLRQHDKWGKQNHPPVVWLTILTEEVGEAAKAVLQDTFPKDDKYSLEPYPCGDSTVEAELVQVAAVAISWIQARAEAERGEKDE